MVTLCFGRKSAEVEQEFDTSIQREAKATEEEAAVRKANHAENKRPDFDLTVDFGCEFCYYSVLVC